MSVVKTEKPSEFSCYDEDTYLIHRVARGVITDRLIAITGDDLMREVRALPEIPAGPLDRGIVVVGRAGRVERDTPVTVGNTTLCAYRTVHRAHDIESHSNLTPRLVQCRHRGTRRTADCIEQHTVSYAQARAYGWVE